MSNSKISQTLVDALSGQHGERYQTLAAILNQFVTGAAHLLKTDPLGSVDVVLSTDAAASAFAAFIKSPNAKTNAAYQKVFDIAIKYHMAYAETCEGDPYPRTLAVRFIPD